VFKFFLVDEHGQVGDPAGFILRSRTGPSARRSCWVTGEKFRILEIRADLLPEMLDAGFNGIFVVEPA
jgi:hypothetical protein